MARAVLDQDSGQLSAGAQPPVTPLHQRAQRYAAAGADGLFVPAVVALPEIRAIASDSTLPLNVLAWEGLAAPALLQEAGVRRLSAGAGLAACVWRQAQALARQFLEQGQLGGKPMSFADLQKLFA